MIKRDLGFWNRRSNVATVWTSFRWTATHIWAHARAPALCIVFVHILLGIQPALLIYVVQHLIDTVVETAGQGVDGFNKTMPWLIAFGLTLLLTNEVLWNIRDALQIKLEQNLTHALGHIFLAKSSKLPLIFFEMSAFYNRLERAKSPGRKLQRFFFATMQAFQASIRAVSVAAMFAWVSPWISLALLVVLIPQIRLEIKQSRMFMAFTYGETEEERRAGYINRMLTGRDEQKEMRLFALHEPLIERWKTKREELRKRLIEQRQSQAIAGLPVAGLRIGVSVGVAALLAYLLGNQILTPGRFVALFQGTNDMLGAGGSLGYSSRELQAQAVEVGYVREFLELPEYENDWTSAQLNSPNPNTPYPSPLRQGLTVDNVWFTYPSAGEEGNENTRSVLQGVSFQLKPGERVALVGENGSGKSTLAKILLGLYTPTSGRILADGIDYIQIDRESLAHSVSAAFQDYFNFELTLAQSIGIGVMRPAEANVHSDLWPLQPDLTLVENAAHRSGADEVAKNLPQGYDTPVGHILNGGQGLSGGEWQRIAVGRAFTRNPELLILDEPAAALDPMAEAGLYRQISDLLEKRTALLISHRLGSARMADRILVLKDGRIVEEGHHDDLLAAGGLYAAMWEEQSSWYR